MNSFKVESKASKEFLARQKEYVSEIFQEIMDEENAKGGKKRAKKKVEVDDYESTDEESDVEAGDMANLTGELYKQLESSMASGDHQLQMKLLQFLVKKNLVDIELIKRMVAHHVFLYPENAPELLQSLRNAQVPIQGAELDDLKLLHMIHLIWLDQKEGKKRFEEAAKAVDPNLDGLGFKPYTKKIAERNPGSVACSSLLSAYGELLQYDAQYWADKEGEAELDFEPLITKLEKAIRIYRAYVHLFIESYVFFLVQVGRQANAEAFITKYVVGEMEDRSASRGIAPLLAYDIVLRIIPDASEEFHQHVLEAVAKVDPANAHVLKLCRIYKEMSYKKPSNSSAPLDSTPSPLGRCLEMVTYFLDQPDPHPRPPHFAEAWSILADVITVICQQGTDEEVKLLLEIWHLNRRSSWPSIHFWFHHEVEDNSLVDKALVAFLLSDEGDKKKHASFTNDVIKEKKSSDLEARVKELGPSQLKLRNRFKQLLPVLMREKYPHRLK